LQPVSSRRDHGYHLPGTGAEMSGKTDP
jgi:hypothetical protein